MRSYNIKYTLLALNVILVDFSSIFKIIFITLNMHTDLSTSKTSCFLIILDAADC